MKKKIKKIKEIQVKEQENQNLGIYLNRALKVKIN